MYKYESCFREENSVKLPILLLHAEFRAKSIYFPMMLCSSCHVWKIQTSTAEDSLFEEHPN